LFLFAFFPFPHIDHRLVPPYSSKGSCTYGQTFQATNSNSCNCHTHCAKLSECYQKAACGTEFFCLAICFTPHCIFFFLDVHPSAAVTVIPGRVQHFTSESVSLKFDRNSAGWSWMNSPRRHDYDYEYHLFNMGYMEESISDIDSHSPYNGVYWRESTSGEFSNAFNITIHGRFYF